jgi:hypothetical protein
MLIIGIIIFSYLIPYIFIKFNKEKWKNKLISESKKFNNIQNFIDIKKYEFEKFDSIVIFILGVSITLFLAAKLSNLSSILTYILLVIGFFLSFSTFINLNRVQQDIIKKLYLLKDKLQI